MKTEYMTPPAITICAALNGSNTALETLLTHYDGYIHKLSLIYIRDGTGQLIRTYLDKDRKQIISIAFIKGVRKFAHLLAAGKIRPRVDSPSSPREK